MVEGAAFYLLCHDDVALDPDALHRLVEESFRSNAGVVSPKFVNWDDPGMLLHVGMSCDKTGAVVDRIVPGEVDHGQHDAVRDVFVAPGGCTLVAGRPLRGARRVRRRDRRDGRGPRPVVALPGRRVPRRRGPRRPRPPPRGRRRRARAAGGGASSRRASIPSTMQALQRRHELRAVLKCYTRIQPRPGAAAGGTAGPRRGRRGAARPRPRPCARRGRRLEVERPPARPSSRLLRGELAEHRLFPDAEVRRLQMRGSARLSSYLSRLSHQGLEAANAVAASRGAHRGRARRGSRPDRQRRDRLQRRRRLRRARRPRPPGRAGTGSGAGSGRRRSARGASVRWP